MYNVCSLNSFDIFLFETKSAETEIVEIWFNFILYDLQNSAIFFVPVTFINSNISFFP